MAKPLRALPACLRGVFAGAGSDGLNEPAICREVLRLTGKYDLPRLVRVGYVGTATYDLEGPMRRQTAWFAEKGCTIVPIEVGRQQVLTSKDAKAAIAALVTVDVVLVSGGNTLYAMERWKLAGLPQVFRECMERGAVMCGGSAGAICWFDAGHSDSLDPDTFRAAMLADATKIPIPAPGKASAEDPTHKDESSAAPTTAAEVKHWRYARVSCLGLLPGLVCPHYDKTQSNGIPRADDFAAMLKRHFGERGLGIDHWAALVVEGNSYRVLSLEGKPGSVGGCAADDAANVDNAVYAPGQTGIPGAWLLQVRDDLHDGGLQVITKLMPWEGALSDILAEPESIMFDPLEDEGRVLNPAQEDGLVMEAV
jgi:dipeptidase E